MLIQLRDQFLAFWRRQTTVQRGVLIGLVAAAILATTLFVIWAGTPTYAVAFTGLSEGDAGMIVEQLQTSNIPYQLRGSGTILVPSNQVYEVRLSMATQGLPQGGTVGFEVFNGMNTLGMTDFTQRVNYQRALEGELERTIGSLTSVAAVRVHIVTPEKSLLAEEQAPTTASITVAFKAGRALDAGQIRAITHLVASSVENMKPENVVVVDTDGNLLASGSSDGDASAASSVSDGRRAAESAYAAQVQKQVRQLLDNVLGPNKSVVQAHVEMDWTQRDVTSQSFDPAGQVLRSQQQLTETYNGAGSSLAGVPGAVSNLPPLTAGATVTGTEGALYQRAEDTSNYEVSQVQEHSIVPPGQLKRISLSVMVDLTDTAKMTTLRNAISAAAGIDTARGDVLAMEQLTFDRSYLTQQATDLQRTTTLDWAVRIGSVIGVVLLLAALLWYLQRLLTNLRMASAQAWTPVAVSGAAALAGLPGAAEAAGFPGIAAPTAPEAALAAPRKPVVDTGMTKADEAMMKTLVKLADENPTTIAEIIHMWLTEDDKRHA